MANEIPDFYRYVFEGKPINYYRTVLRASVKFLLAFNQSISSAKQYNTECYAAYFVLKDSVLEKAKYGQRFRFVTYQPAFVASMNSDMAVSKIYKRLIPHALKEGTVVKVVVPQESENCAILSKMLHSEFFHDQVVIPPYACFKFKGFQKIETDSDDYKGFKQVVITLDKHKSNFQEDEMYWMKEQADIELNQQLSSKF